VKWSIAAILALVALSGCTGGELEANRRRWAMERRHLEDTLEALEERLIVNQSRVRFWREMKERHEGVTAVACEIQERHADAMASFETRQREAREAKARRSRMASYVTDQGPKTD
jgi:hypothetical protein